MSSPTVLFVLQEIFNELTSADNNEHVLSFAFGPGLTLESMMLRIESK
jgi:predicted naringenin-chalcone synthase